MLFDVWLCSSVAFLCDAVCLWLSRSMVSELRRATVAMIARMSARIAYCAWLITWIGAVAARR